MCCLKGTELARVPPYVYGFNKLEGANVLDGRLREVLGEVLRLLITATIYSENKVERNRVG